MKIVILEDGQDQMEWLVAEVKKKFNDAIIEEVTTEHEFQQRIPSFQQNPPDAFILDIMVRWTNPGRNMPEPPEDVRAEKYYRAGMRCMQKVRAGGIDSPIILYSILENSDLREDLARLDAKSTYIQKTANGGELLKVLQQKVKHSHS